MQNPFSVDHSPHVCDKKWSIPIYVTFTCNWLDWTGLGLGLGLVVLGLCLNGFLVSVSVSVSRYLVSVLALVSLCSGLIKHGKLAVTGHAACRSRQATQYFVNQHGQFILQAAQLSQRDRAAGCVIVLAKSGRLELGDIFYGHARSTLSNSVKKRKIRTVTAFKVIQGHRGRYQSKARMRLPISD